MTGEIGLWLLFSSSFLASTLLPGGSEATLAFAHSEAIASATTLLFVATLGNTLGGMTSWGLGWLWQRHYPAKRMQQPREQKALERIRHYGSPLLLLAWLPLIGDPLCLAAGWSGIRWLPALIFIAIGKALRYAALLWILPVSG